MKKGIGTKRNKKRIIINIIAICLMLTGPVLMILPGPQLLSWLGLGIFMWNNRSFFERWLWAQYLMCYVEFKVDIIREKINGRKTKKDN